MQNHYEQISKCYTVLARHFAELAAAQAPAPAADPQPAVAPATPVPVPVPVNPAPAVAQAAAEAPPAPAAITAQEAIQRLGKVAAMMQEAGKDARALMTLVQAYGKATVSEIDPVNYPKLIADAEAMVYD